MRFTQTVSPQIGKQIRSTTSPLDRLTLEVVQPPQKNLASMYEDFDFAVPTKD
jgi:hypothetical protein